jgi:hypothetical protein
MDLVPGELKGKDPMLFSRTQSTLVSPSIMFYLSHVEGFRVSTSERLKED